MMALYPGCSEFCQDGVDDGFHYGVAGGVRVYTVVGKGDGEGAVAGVYHRGVIVGKRD